MKKIFAFVAAAVCTLAAMANNYEGQLTVTVNGDTTQQATNITVEQVNGAYNLSIKNFALIAGDQKMPVGTIQLDGCQGKEAYGITTINYDKSVSIKAGDDPTVDTWLGPALGDVPIKMEAKLNNQVLSVNISIYLAILEQNINVSFVGAGAAGDVNTDGVVNSSDVAALIAKILAQ